MIILYYLGISFLRHIERCRCLLFVIDMSEKDPQEQLKCLKYELDQYLPGLSERPNGIIANKVDLKKAKDNVEKFRQNLGSEAQNLILISAKQNQNISQLLTYICDLRDNNMSCSQS